MEINLCLEIHFLIAKEYLLSTKENTEISGRKTPGYVVIDNLSPPDVDFYRNE